MASGAHLACGSPPRRRYRVRGDPPRNPGDDPLRDGVCQRHVLVCACRCARRRGDGHPLRRLDADHRDGRAGPQRSEEHRVKQGACGSAARRVRPRIRHVRAARDIYRVRAVAARHRCAGQGREHLPSHACRRDPVRGRDLQEGARRAHAGRLPERPRPAGAEDGHGALRASARTAPRPTIPSPCSRR